MVTNTPTLEKLIELAVAITQAANLGLEDSTQINGEPELLMPISAAQDIETALELIEALPQPDACEPDGQLYGPATLLSYWLRHAIAAESSADMWQPIATVPRDGTCVDLWAPVPNSCGVREIDVCWNDHHKGWYGPDCRPAPCLPWACWRRPNLPQVG